MRSFAYSKNNSGPKLSLVVQLAPLSFMTKCNFLKELLQSVPLISTNWSWFDKYDLNHKFSSPLVTYEFSLSNNVSWFIISNAFDGSKHIPIAWSPLFEASCILSRTVWLAVSVDLFFLNPFWASSNYIIFCKKDIYINYSSILENTDKMYIRHRSVISNIMNVPFL
jgi:hypothetical protein